MTDAHVNYKFNHTSCYIYEIRHSGDNLQQYTANFNSIIIKVP